MTDLDIQTLKDYAVEVERVYEEVNNMAVGTENQKFDSHMAEAAECLYKARDNLMILIKNKKEEAGDV